MKEIAIIKEGKSFSLIYDAKKAKEYVDKNKEIIIKTISQEEFNRLQKMDISGLLRELVDLFNND